MSAISTQDRGIWWSAPQARGAHCLGLVATLVAAAGCGGVEDPGAADPSVGQAEAPILKGTAIADDYSGHLALEVYVDSLQNYFAYCSATLITNTVALTAKHCLSGTGVTGRQIYARMGGQRMAITSSATHPTLDVAVVRFPAMVMLNWDQTHFGSPIPFLGPIAIFATSGYQRALYGGSNASLNNTNLTCFGDGPGGVGAPMTTATFKTTYNDGFNPSGSLHVWPNGAGQMPQLGDSGMGCGPQNQTYQSPLAFVLSGLEGSLFAYGTGIESFRSWFGF
jgi:hypothetical protein